MQKPLEFLPTKPRTESIWWPRANEPLASPVVEASTCAAWREGLGSCCVTYGLVWTPRAVSSLASSLSKLTVGTHSLLLRSDLEMDKSRKKPKVTQELHAPRLFRNTEAALPALPPSAWIRKGEKNCIKRSWEVIDRICRLLNLVGLGLCCHAFAGQSDPPFSTFCHGPTLDDWIPS